MFMTARGAHRAAPPPRCSACIPVKWERIALTLPGLKGTVLFN